MPLDLKSILSILPYWGFILVWFFIFFNKDRVLSKSLFIASLRVSFQLILLAVVLETIFKSTLFLTTLLVSFVMTLNSSFQIGFKAKKEKLKLVGMTFFSQTLALWPLAFFFAYDENPSGFSSPEILLPLLGMLLGNSLNGLSIAREQFSVAMEERQDEVLTLLALGATPKEATKGLFFKALKIGITPQLNSMLAMGIVSIPGMMAGQLIAKADAFAASLTQIKMMLSVLCGTITCIYLMMIMLRKRYFTSKGELCLK